MKHRTFLLKIYKLDVPLGLSYTILAIQTHGNQPSLLLILDGKHTTQYARVDYPTRTFAEAIGAIISLLAN